MIVSSPAHAIGEGMEIRGGLGEDCKKGVGSEAEATMAACTDENSPGGVTALPPAPRSCIVCVQSTMSSAWDAGVSNATHPLSPRRLFGNGIEKMSPLPTVTPMPGKGKNGSA